MQYYYWNKLAMRYHKVFWSNLGQSCLNGGLTNTISDDDVTKPHLLQIDQGCNEVMQRTQAQEEGTPNDCIGVEDIDR